MEEVRGYPPVLTKTDFVRRYARGEFGNCAPTWNNVAEFLHSGYTGLIHVRNRIAGAQTWYNVPAKDAKRIWNEAAALFSPSLLYISAMAPTEKTLIQGEVQHSSRYLDLYYTNVRKPMRDALVEWNHSVAGLVAAELLRYFLCPRSHDWLWVLLDRYPDHVVEFSTYDCEWGTLPGYNTVFWEVRKY